MNKLACKESIAYLWGYPDGSVKKPGTLELFKAISGEALVCLSRTDWEDRIRRIENILSVIKWRMERHRERVFEDELERFVESARRVGPEENKEVDRNVG